MLSPRPPRKKRPNNDRDKRIDWRRFWNLYKGGMIGFLIMVGGIYLMMALGILELK